MINTSNSKLELIQNFLKSLNESDLMFIHNCYCESINDYDNMIYSMDEFDEILEGYTSLNLALTIFNGRFNPNDEYFWFNGYANLESDYTVKYKVDIQEIASYILENNESYGYDELTDILEK